MENKEQWLTPEEIADSLRVSRRTVYNWLLKEGLKGKKLGRLWRIRKEDLEKFLDEK